MFNSLKGYTLCNGIPAQYSYIYTSKGEITCTVSFNKMEELLGTQFFLRFIEAIRLIENIFVYLVLIM